MVEQSLNKQWREEMSAEVKRRDMEEQWWELQVSGHLEELGELQRKGEIHHLKWRFDKNTGSYIVRFMPTKGCDILYGTHWAQFFNYSDYLPDEYEERKKWCPW